MKHMFCFSPVTNLRGNSFGSWFGLRLKFLVAERWPKGNDDDIKSMTCSTVAGITGSGEQPETFNKLRLTAGTKCSIHTVKCRKQQGQFFYFRPLSAIGVDIVQYFPDFIPFKTCQRPVAVDACKP